MLLATGNFSQPSLGPGRFTYGLKSSGLRWHERFSDVLRNVGFIPNKAECEIWILDVGDHYEH